MTIPTPDTTSEITIFDAGSSSSNPYLNVLLLGNKWGGPVGSSATVYYSFPTSRSDEYWSQDFINGYGINDPMPSFKPDYVSLTPLSTSQQYGITLALNAWSNVANLDFIKVNETPSAVGDIRFGFTSDGAMSPNIYAYTYSVDPYWYAISDTLPYTRSGDIWFNKTQPYPSGNNFSTGAMGYLAGLHEIGHALGLDHSFAEEEGDIGLPANIDYFQYTVMSYSDLPGNYFDGLNEYYPTTPMLYDILAIQHLYGANNDYNSGDNVYEFSSSQRYYQTIWDAGGNDTIKYISPTGGLINLEAGTFSQLGRTFKVGPNNSTIQQENVAIAFNVLIENAIGGNGNDRISGNSSDNILDGGAGNDTLDGKGGNDTLIGGKGNDTYIIDNSGVTVTEQANEGIDQVNASLSYTLAANVENLLLTGTNNINGTGNELANTITGNAGNNTLDGGAGVDKLAGGLGNDTYLVDLIQTGTAAAAFRVALQDTITEAANAGNDTIKLRGDFNHITATTLTLGANLENLDASATGTTKLNLTGNTLANTLTGNDADNILDGGAGLDTLIGGEGNDTYILDLKATAGILAIEDTVSELNDTTDGVDTIKLRGSVSLTDATTLSLDGSSSIGWTNVENIDASTTGVTKLNLTGNEFNNSLTGNAAANIIDGGLGNDNLDGGAGNDTLIGGLGNDTLNGGLGADRMVGGNGDDTYFVDNIADIVTEQVNQGDDLVKVSITYSLASAANIENLELLGTAAINGTGNADANIITGNTGNNILDGGAGVDTLIGGKGNDTYIVDNIADVVTELENEGIDLVKANATHTLSANVENLTLTDGSVNGGSATINGTGNALANIITGNAGDNILDGGDGADKLIGGLGDDTYLVDLIQTGTAAAAFRVALQDTITEAANAGNDTIKLRGDFNHITATTLTLGANLENLDASATGTTKLNLTGNTLANTLTGNDADNILDGGAGLDTLIGGEGNDTYILDLKATAGILAIEDTVSELNDTTDGVDTIKLRGSVSLTDATTLSLDGSSPIGWTNVENIDASTTGVTKLNLTGNEFNNSLTGNAAANIIDGGLGNDNLDGGAGNDTLIGGLGNDTLNGGLGADRMVGGNGDDTYFVDNIADIVTEQVNQGDDLVKVSITYSLASAANIENLELLGTAAINGTGNADANIITGNTGNNILDGGAGVDTLIGGKGNDTYIVDNIADVVTELENEGIDLVKANATHTLSANVENLTLTDGSVNGGSATINGTGNALANIITGNAGDNILDGGDGADKLIGGLGDDTYLVDLIQTGTAAAAFRVALQDTITEAANAGNDTVKLRGDFNHITATTLTLGANLENLDASATGTTKLNLTGNALANTLTGNDANNILDGGAGNDILIGGLGSDTLKGGSGTDYFKYSSTLDSTSNGMDIITDFARGIDKIDLSELDGGEIALSFANTIATANSIWFSQSSGITFVYVDTSGDTTADFQIQLTGNINLVASDFVYNTSQVNDLFTEFDDEINLNSINIDRYNITYIYNALAGNDIVTLPDSYTRAALLNYDHTQVFHGGDGEDTILGGSLDDIISGDDGIDTLAGGLGSDTYIVDLIQTGTTAANYRVVLQDTITETAVAGSGNDTVKLRGSFDHLNATTLTVVANLENLDASLTGSTKLNLTGNNLANTIIGNDADNILDGGADNDYLVGGKGSDTLYGGAGDDTLRSGDGLGIDYAYLDTLHGGEGNDIYIISGYEGEYRPSKVIETLSVAAGGGIDTVFTNYSYALPQYVENLTFDNQVRTAGYTLRGVGNELNNILQGDINSNLLIGGAGDDIIDGGIVTSLSGGGSQEDYLYGGLGNDKMYGQDGMDVYYINGSIEHQVAEIFDNSPINTSSAANLLYFNSSIENDTLRLFSGDTGVTHIYIQKMLFDLDQVDGIKRLVDYAASDASTLNVDASALTNKVEIVGNGGDNILTSSSFNDLINGYSGNDTIIGGAGSDSLYGGFGADTFKWNLHDNGLTKDLSKATDTVFDFELAEGDKLNFKDLLIGETKDNILQYLDVVTTQFGETQIRISSHGGFTGGNYNSANEDGRVILFNTDIFRDSSTSTEAALIQHMINNQSLVID